MAMPKVTCGTINYFPGLQRLTRTNSRVKETTRNSVEDPCCDCQREAEGETDEHQLLHVRSVGRRQNIGDLGGGESEV